MKTRLLFKTGIIAAFGASVLLACTKNNKTNVTPVAKSDVSEAVLKNIKTWALVQTR
jgi:hypothetical protein